MRISILTINEFDIISHYFTRPKKRSDVMLSVGDDCALLSVPQGQLLAVSIDTLNENIHFLPDMPAHALGYKALAVNLSDLAAMGASPAWATMALTLPEVNDAWLKDFSEGFFSLASTFQVDLVGGNLSRGPRSVTIQVHGFIPPDQAIKRSTAKAGDLIFVSGHLGGAAAALCIYQKNIAISAEHKKSLNQAWYYPSPQIALGKKLIGLASSAIDLSDGLLGDLSHILTQSQVGAEIFIDKIPTHPLLATLFSQDEARHFALSGGEDFELCFTVPRNKLYQLPSDMPLTCIGKITEEKKLKLLDAHGEPYLTHKLGYTHF